jgi:hypothetical protein
MSPEASLQTVGEVADRAGSGAVERFVRQVPVAIVAPVRQRRLAPLRRLLERIGEDPAGNSELPFGRMRGVHFARLVLLEVSRDLDDARISGQLIYMSDVDEPLSAHLDDLLHCEVGLDAVFGNCSGYPSRGVTRDARRRWLECHLIQTQAFYVNTVGRGVLQIQRESLLRSEIEQFLDEHDWEGREPLDVRAAILDRLRRRPELAWALTPVPGPGSGEVVRNVLAVALPVAGLAAAAPVLVALLPLYAAVVRWHEAHDYVDTARPTAAQERLLGELEDYGPQNQFSAIGLVKTGRLRSGTVAAALRGLDLAARHVFNKGTLTGVKTIHFAHWTRLDQGRRLIFASNYDGTVKSYNDDFIDRVWWGLNLVFSNGFGWPRTRFLIWGGAQNEQPFKNYLRCHQIPTQVWYSAYPGLTAANITNNAKVRAGLSGFMNSSEAERWLHLI